MIFVIPAKAGIRMIEAKLAARSQLQIAVIGSLPLLWAYRGRLGETKKESRAINPFPLDGGRLGWGRGARKRGYAGGTPALPDRQPTRKPFAGEG